MWIEPIVSIEKKIGDIQEIWEEVLQSEDAAFISELEQAVMGMEEKLKELELKRMLSQPMDKNACYFSIYAGAGGTESCDWVEMLYRMYQRWMQAHHWELEVIDLVEGEVAGIKSITVKVVGDYAYGYARSEKGVHRLVRISPFDSNAKRHTSFAAVDVIPELDETIDIEIRSEDLKIDTFRSSGAGGQHVNTTDSAVRITHIPSHIVVTCRKERSQVQNKEMCLKMLKAKLYEREKMQKKETVEAISGDKADNAWGNQIRSYVFQPYTLVKDNRTGYQVGNIQAMMDGELLDEFVCEYLKMKG